MAPHPNAKTIAETWAQWNESHLLHGPLVREETGASLFLFESAIGPIGANVSQGLYGILVITPDGKVYESLGLTGH